MTEVKKSDNRILHKLAIILMTVGDSIILLGLMLIPNILQSNNFLFTLGACLFIFGLFCTFFGLIIITGISMKLL